MSICIVGNGILGLMTAYTLSARAPDLKICVIGKHERPGCASLAAAAMFNSFCEVESGTLSNPMERERFLSNKMSNALWPDLLKNLAAESKQELHHAFGTFLISNTTTDDLEDDNFQAIRQALIEFKEPYSDVDPREIKNYKPAATKRAVHAMFIKNEGWVNPRHLLSALDTILSKRKNVELRDANANRIQITGGKVTGVELDDKTTINADAVLACNGAEFTNLMNRSGLEKNFQRVFYGVGSTIVLECGDTATTHCVRTPNRGLACGLYSAPQTKTEVVVGASNFISPVGEFEPRLTSVYTLLKNAMEQINADYFRARLLRVNCGWRPTSSDTLPLIGPTSVGGLFAATGTKRDGLHCSPVISGYLADMITSGKSSLNMDMYKPERPLTRLYSREDAISKYVKHTINALYQHDFVPAKNKIVEELATYYRDEFSALHDQVGAKDWGIPIEMKDMYKHGHIR